MAKKAKKTKKETLWFSGKLAIRPDRPRRPIQIGLLFGVVGVFWQ